MTRDEQFRTLLRLYIASIEHNIVLRGKLTISQPIGTGVDENIKEALEEAEEALNRLEPNMIAHQRVCAALDTAGPSAINPEFRRPDDDDDDWGDNEDATLRRIYKILFGGEFKDQKGFLITPAADRNLLRAIETVKALSIEPRLDYAAKIGLPSAERNKLLVILGRVHDQLQDIRNILKGKGYE